MCRRFRCLLRRFAWQRQPVRAEHGQRGVRGAVRHDVRLGGPEQERVALRDLVLPAGDQDMAVPATTTDSSSSGCWSRGLSEPGGTEYDIAWNGSSRSRPYCSQRTTRRSFTYWSAPALRSNVRMRRRLLSCAAKEGTEQTH
jgi:hypothetical protein